MKVSSCNRALVTSYYDRVATDSALVPLEKVAEVVRLFPGRRVTRDEMMEHLPHVDAVLISDEVFDAAVFQEAPRLGMICADGVGVNSVDLDAATKAGVIVNNAPFVHEANGDFTIGLILALLRRIVAADRGVRAGRWNERKDYLGTGLSGLSLGLLGFGRAAQAVARRAVGFNCEILAYCRQPDVAAAEALGVTLVDFETLLGQSDILSIHVKLTGETTGMIARPQIDRMKAGAYLVNTSRGLVCDEPSLIEALQNGKLAGAAIDVFPEEPPPTDHPLFAMENVVVTPHMASDATEAFHSVFQGAVKDMLLFFGGLTPTHVVNPAVLSHPRVCQLGADSSSNESLAECGFMEEDGDCVSSRE